MVGFGLLNDGSCPFDNTEERLLPLKCCSKSSPAIPMLDRLRLSKWSSALLRLTLERRRWRRMLGFLMIRRPSVFQRRRVRVSNERKWTRTLSKANLPTPKTSDLSINSRTKTTHWIGNTLPQYNYMHHVDFIVHVSHNNHICSAQ